MKIGIERLGLLFDPRRYFSRNIPLTHAANPVVIPINQSTARIFFNSRDSMQKSSIYSIDIDMNALEVNHNSFQEQHLLTDTQTYYKDGISLGSEIMIDNQVWIGFMGWVNPPDEHWFGQIGKLMLDDNFNVKYIESEPWFALDQNDPISLSYPAFYSRKSETRMWYGSTLTWDAGNGEMIHILKEKTSDDGVNFEPTGRIVEWELNIAQAFSRPSIVALGNSYLLAYSVRGNATKYQIGFSLIEEDNIDCGFALKQIKVFGPSESEWENEMVEYPYLINHKNNTYMFYNGNAFGRTGIGLARLFY